MSYGWLVSSNWRGGGERNQIFIFKGGTKTYISVLLKIGINFRFKLPGILIMLGMLDYGLCDYSLMKHWTKIYIETLIKTKFETTFRLKSHRSASSDMSVYD